MYQLVLSEVFGLNNGRHLSLIDIYEEPQSDEYKKKILSDLKKELVSNKNVKEKTEYVFYHINRRGQDGKVV